jgi:hypothetical protein
MTDSKIAYLSYKEIRKRQRTDALGQFEIPIEHAISLPLPTKRWAGPAYASFASPALRVPSQPLKQGAPDRWWVVDAQTGHLIVYALWNAMAYAEGVDWTTITLPEENRSIAQLRESLATIELLMDTLAPAFFADQPADETTRKALSEALSASIPEPLLPQYRMLAPDFFAWLES